MTIAGIIFYPVWTNLYCSAVPSMFCNTPRIVDYPNNFRQEININAAGIFIFYPDMSESILLLLFKFIIMVFKVAEKKREIQ